MDQENLTPSDSSVSSRSVPALYFAIPGSQGSPTGFPTVRRWSRHQRRAKTTRLHQRTLRLLILSLCDPKRPSFTNSSRNHWNEARQLAAGYLLRPDLRHFHQLSHHLRHAVPEEVAVALVPARPTSRPHRKSPSWCQPKVKLFHHSSRTKNLSQNGFSFVSNSISSNFEFVHETMPTNRTVSFPQF